MNGSIPLLETKPPIPAISISSAPYKGALKTQRYVEKIEEYRIRDLGFQAVFLVSPKGSPFKSLFDLVRIQAAIKGKISISLQLLNLMGRDPFSRAERGRDTEICVQGLAPDSCMRTRSEQEARGWTGLDPIELILAHTAYHLVTGKDLFRGHYVRAIGATLHSFHYGLDVCTEMSDTARHPLLGACYNLMRR